MAYSVDGAGALTTYLADALGSVRALTDAAGQVVQTYQTDEFGVPVAAGTLGSRAQPFGYTGEQADSTGLLYLRARMYDPQAGRFLSKDPFAGLVSSPQSLNRYAYVGNNPVNLVDPSGMVWERTKGYLGFTSLGAGSLGLGAGSGAAESAGDKAVAHGAAQAKLLRQAGEAPSPHWYGQVWGGQQVRSAAYEVRAAWFEDAGQTLGVAGKGLGRFATGAGAALTFVDAYQQQQYLDRDRTDLSPGAHILRGVVKGAFAATFSTGLGIVGANSGAALATGGCLAAVATAWAAPGCGLAGAAVGAVGGAYFGDTAGRLLADAALAGMDRLMGRP